MALPIVLVPGLLVTARLYAEQIPALWRLGPVTVADHTRDDSMAAIARRILADAPPRFALAGLSMGGHVAFEIVRRAPERVARLALLSTSARLDPPEITERRRRQIALAQEGRFGADGIPGARLATVAECGHLSTLERPAQVTAALTDWLQA